MINLDAEYVLRMRIICIRRLRDIFIYICAKLAIYYSTQRQYSSDVGERLLCSPLLQDMMSIEWKLNKAGKHEMYASESTRKCVMLRYIWRFAISKLCNCNGSTRIWKITKKKSDFHCLVLSLHVVDSSDICR